MKYIVYKTTNLINNKIYIGVHKTENPNIFDGYIGCGCYINKSSTYKYPKTYFQKAVNKYGPSNFRRETIGIFNTEQEAYLAESLLVNEDFLARDDVYNMVLGGRDVIDNTVECYSYDEQGYYCNTYKSLTEAGRIVNKSMSTIYSAIIFKYKCGGFYWQTLKLDKIDISEFSKPIKNIKVYRYLVDGGAYDSEFDSLSKAASNSSLTLIQVARSARLGYRAGSYQFSFIKSDSYDRACTIYTKIRPVHKYSKEGLYIESYESQEEAEKLNKGSNISKSIKNKKPCDNNYLWSLEKLDKFCSTQSKKKKVGMFSLEGTLIKEWESIKDCVSETGINKYVIKVQKPCKGYIYKCI